MFGSAPRALARSSRFLITGMAYAAVVEAREIVERSPEMRRLRRVLARKRKGPAAAPYAAVVEAAEIAAKSPEIRLLRRALALKVGRPSGKA